MQPDTVTTAEAAFLLDVSIATVNRWAKSGRLRPARQGGGKTSPRVFWRDDVEDEARRVAVGRRVHA